jgi:hypothetical protein
MKGSTTIVPSHDLVVVRGAEAESPVWQQNLASRL